MIYLFFKIKKEDVYPIKFILEGFENMMIVSTVDEELPKIQITIAPDFETECRKILKDLSQKYLMIPVEDNPHVSQGHF